jgi:hypothetical protein
MHTKLESSETNVFWIQASIISEEQAKNSLLKWNWDLTLKFTLVRLLPFEDGDGIFFLKVDKKLTKLNDFLHHNTTVSLTNFTLDLYHNLSFNGR